jgi:hypothetical protein
LVAIASERFAHFSTVRTYGSTIDGSNYTGNLTVFALVDAVSTCKIQPPWEFLLSASRNSLQSFELSRLSHASNLRKEITQLLDSWLEENSEALLARWLMEQREHPATREECERSAAPVGNDARPPAGDARGNAAHSVSYNFFADQAGSQPGFCTRS